MAKAKKIEQKHIDFFYEYFKRMTDLDSKLNKLAWQQAQELSAWVWLYENNERYKEVAERILLEVINNA